MRSYVAVSLFAFSASVFSAPTPQIGLNNVAAPVNGVVGDVLNSATGATDELDLNSLTGGLKEKRQVVGGLTKPLNSLVGDVTKTRLIGNARRQVKLPLVKGATNMVDGITGQLNTNGAVNGVNTNVNQKRQLKPPVIPGVTKTVDGVTDSINLAHAVDGVNTDVSSKRDILGLGEVDDVTDEADDVTGGLLDTGDLLDLDINIKRDIPIVQDLPLISAVDGITSDTPVVSEVTDAVHGVTGDLDPVTGAVYNAAQPVTDATELLNARSADVADLGETLNSVTNTVSGSGNGNGNGNNILSGNSLVHDINV